MDSIRKYFGAADIGTTTVECTVLDGSGTVLASTREWNAQRKYGTDIVTRLAGGAGGGWRRLSETLILQIQNAFRTLCREAGITPEEMERIALSGNTVMLHYAAGMDPTGLGTAPFRPQSLFGTERDDIRNGIRIYAAPCIGAYAGGDLVSGLLACGMTHGSGSTLFADIGTNGEIAAWNGERLLVCSTSAGPAFEGIGIGCGMPALPGAVRRITWSADRGFIYEVIGDGEPKGICGSGLMDLLAVLLRTGALERNGRWNRQSSLFDEYRFACSDETGIRLPGTRLELNQKDIRQLQLAKGAVRAGMELLLEKCGLGKHGPDRLILSGGFSEYLDPDSAFEIGLLPKGIRNRICLAGNTSLRGAAMLARSEEARKEAGMTAADAGILGLSGNAEFSELFVKHLSF